MADQQTTYYLMKDGCVVVLNEEAKTAFDGSLYYEATGIGPFAWTECEEHYTYSANPDSSIPYVKKTTDLRMLKYFIDNGMREKIYQLRHRKKTDQYICQEISAIQCCECKRFECDKDPFHNNWVQNNTVHTFWCPQCFIDRASQVAECSRCSYRHINRVVHNFDDKQVGNATFMMFRYRFEGGRSNFILCNQCQDFDNGRVFENNVVLDVDIIDAGHDGDEWVWGNRDW